MALNLGPEAYEAIQRLKNSSDWRAFVDSLHTQMALFMSRALDVPSDDRADATGYARGLRDIVLHIELIENPKAAGRQPKPVVRVKELADG